MADPTAAHDLPGPEPRAADEELPPGGAAAGDAAADTAALAASMRSEYELLVKAVAEFDARLLTIKGWSVTLSLAALVLGFQHDHYALFGLAAVSALGFWAIDAVTKTHQMRHYPRMRDIEVAAYYLNRIELPGAPGTFSSPRIDASWSSAGRARDGGAMAPSRRDPDDVRRLLRWSWCMAHVALPHAIGAVVGTLLFALAALGVGRLGEMPL